MVEQGWIEHEDRQHRTKSAGLTQGRVVIEP
jgi:hypothetical protein